MDPSTSDEELTSCIDSIKGEIKVVGVLCTKLKSQFEDLYSSYHVSVRVDAIDFAKAIDVFMSEDGWPTGVFCEEIL